MARLRALEPIGRVGWSIRVYRADFAWPETGVPAVQETAGREPAMAWSTRPAGVPPHGRVIPRGSEWTGPEESAVSAPARLRIPRRPAGPKLLGMTMGGRLATAAASRYQHGGRLAKRRSTGGGRYRSGESGLSPQSSDCRAPSSGRPRHSKRFRTCWPRRSPRTGVARIAVDQRPGESGRLVRGPSASSAGGSSSKPAQALLDRVEGGGERGGVAVAGLAEGPQGLERPPDPLQDGAGVGQVEARPALVVVVLHAQARE